MCWQAFAVAAKDAASAPDGYITQLSGGGRTYHVYVHRCLFPSHARAVVFFPLIIAMPGDLRLLPDSVGAAGSSGLLRPLAPWGPPCTT